MNIMMWVVLFGIGFNAIAGTWLIRSKHADLGLWLLGLAAMSVPLFIMELVS